MRAHILHAAKPGNATTDPAEATKDPDFAIQGEYAASAAIRKDGGGYGLQVVALGDGEFQAALYKGGLPGSGAENNEFVLLKGETKGGKTILKASGGETVVIKGDTATGTKDDEKLFVYDRVERKSPTLGKKPPKGAKILFGGKGTDRFSDGKKVDGELLKEGVVSMDSFGDFTLHLEFRTPYKPKIKTGSQDRGNSGVYIFNNYETQILDSFGIKGEFNFCGALYRKKPPAMNLCLPPLAWQTTMSTSPPLASKTAKKSRTPHHHPPQRDPHTRRLRTGQRHRSRRRTPRKGKGPNPPPRARQPRRFQNIWLVEK